MKFDDRKDGRYCKLFTTDGKGEFFAERIVSSIVSQFV